MAAAVPSPQCGATSNSGSFRRGAVIIILLLPAVVAALVFAVAQCASWATENRSGASSGAAGRGSYLVRHVAMCVQCHSSRDEKGGLVKSRLLMGGAIPLQQPYPNQPWALYAPRIAGLPGWQKEAVIQLLVNGRTPDGFTPRPPMPPFRLSQRDAIEVVEYLQSLP